MFQHHCEKEPDAVKVRTNRSENSILVSMSRFEMSSRPRLESVAIETISFYARLESESESERSE